MSTGFPDWTRAYLLIGSHEGELIPVYVDEDGHLYAALQGEYEGQLRTIALDDQGRISAFVIDSSDAWGQMLACGNAELAARLTRSLFGDGRGRYLYRDDFSMGLDGVRVVTSGADVTIALSPNYWAVGGYSAACTLPAGTDKSGSIQREFAGKWDVPLGVAVNFIASTTKAWAGLRLSMFNGSSWRYAGINYAGDENSLYYYNASGSWSILGVAGAFPRSIYAWTLFKLVADPTVAEYQRCVFGGQLLDMAGIKCYEGASADPPRFIAIARGIGSPADASIVYLDDYVVTSEGT